MGREVKRVEADFEWPLKKVWRGFINPHYSSNRECPFCAGSGWNPETKKIYDNWYDHDTTGTRWCHNITQDEVQALADARRLMDFTHHYISGKGWVENDPLVIPTAEEVNAWSRKGTGHDSSSHYTCVKTRAERLGVYGDCSHCKGEGNVWLSETERSMSEAWTQTQPPAGDWYQVWETVSEGSPISPSFKEPEELAKWLFENNASTMGHATTTYENWLKFIKGPGWACSMVVQDGVMKSGVDAIVEKERS